MRPMVADLLPLLALLRLGLDGLVWRDGGPERAAQGHLVAADVA